MVGKASVYGLDGKQVKQVALPSVFQEEYHPDLIKRAVLSGQSAAKQPKGAYARAGRNTTAVYRSMRQLPSVHRIMNTGRARLPHKKNRRYLIQGDVAGVPHAVGGPRAHPPKALKVIAEKINKKEKKKAVKSALAATIDKDLVKERGHLFGEKFPLIVVDELEALAKASQVVKALKALEVYSDVEKAKNSRKIRAGKGKMRGRKYKKKKSLLIVASNLKGIEKGARNLSGVEVIEASKVGAEDLAPGTVPGRLTIYSEAAVKELGEKK